MKNENEILSEGQGPNGKGKRKRNIPVKEADLLNQALRICESWKANPHITLLDMDAIRYELLVVEGLKIYDDRLASEGGRKSLTSKLTKLDKEIDRAVGAVKLYVGAKYTSVDDAKPHYSKFGLEHGDSGHRMPKDRAKRQASLKMMVKAIGTEGFGQMEYGTAWWTAKNAEYVALCLEATDNDQEVSGFVGTKNELIAKIKEVMISLRMLIVANYRDNAPAVLRQWGFLKEYA